jgi:hypothetical protein
MIGKAGTALQIREQPGLPPAARRPPLSGGIRVDLQHRRLRT